MNSQDRSLFSVGKMGMVVGCLLSVALFTGWYLGSQHARPALPAELIKATAGYGTENFAMCTGYINDDIEGIFTLDYLTGELQCWVLSPRGGGWLARYKRNVAADLEVEAGKKPSFVLCTGAASFPANVGGVRPSRCVVYVADANTGKFGCYVVPLVQGALAAGEPQWGTLVPLAAGAARSVEIRK
jgi:hypothetical protein